jgi:biotin-(acetyl-CoA carboxylase) ligase
MSNRVENNARTSKTMGIRRNQIMGFLLEELLDTCAVFETQGLKPFIKEYNALDATFQKPVKIMHQNLSIEGIGRGIDEKGYFLLEDEQNKIQRFICAEASLRVDN